MSVVRFNYINLDRREDRRDFVESQLRKDCGPNLHRFSAVSAKDVENESGVHTFPDYGMTLTIDEKTKVNIATKQRYYHYEMDNWAQVACAYSHITLWTQIVKDTSLSDKDVWVIFEDDIVVCNNQWLKEIPDVLKEITENGIDVFMLDVVPREAEIKFKGSEKTKYLVELRKFWGTHAYFLTKKGALGLLNYLEKHCQSQLREQADAIIYNANRLGYLKAGAMQRKDRSRWFRQDEKQFGTDVQIIWNPNLKD